MLSTLLMLFVLFCYASPYIIFWLLCCGIYKLLIRL